MVVESDFVVLDAVGEVVDDESWHAERASRAAQATMKTKCRILFRSESSEVSGRQAYFSGICTNDCVPMKYIIELD